MNKPQPTLQAAVVTGLDLLADPAVRVPASQAEGLVALRTLLQGLASGQLVVSEPALPPPESRADAPKKVRAPRRTKAQIAAAANGATPPTAVAAPAATQ